MVPSSYQQHSFAKKRSSFEAAAVFKAQPEVTAFGKSLVYKANDWGPMLALESLEESHKQCLAQLSAGRLRFTENWIQSVGHSAMIAGDYKIQIETLSYAVSD